MLFHNVYICDFDYIYTITLKDGKPYFGEQLGSVYHKRADITISIYNQDIKKEARLIPCREGYLVYKYMELNFLK